MAMLHELPYLGNIKGGMALRNICTKIHSYAQLDKDRGGNFGATKLVPFLKEQIELGGKPSGFMTDGSYLGLPALDPRPQFYTVLSALRLWGNAEQKEAFNAFCWYLINEYQAPEPSKED